jgi:5-carboxymethyl-2-hydroxymuconate isomerase
MPHLVLEYSANVPDEPDMGVLLARLHEAVRASGPFDLTRIKSRVVRHEVFRAADGAPDRAFVHLTVSVLAGHDAEALHVTAEALLAALHDAFPRARAERRCDITLEIREMRRDLYFKAGDPTAS